MRRKNTMEQFPKNQPSFVCYALKRCDIAQVDIADDLGLKPTTVWGVVNGRGRSKKVEDRIAELTGVQLHALWPEWYGPNNKPIHKRKRALTRFERTQRFDAVCTEINALMAKPTAEQKAA